MAEVPVERRFRGTVRLATLHLWRVAQSTDLEEGFAEARKLGMIRAEHENFIRECFALDAQLEAGEEPSTPITMERVSELQLCVLRLNTADPA